MDGRKDYAVFIGSSWRVIHGGSRPPFGDEVYLLTNDRWQTDSRILYGPPTGARAAAREYGRRVV